MRRSHAELRALKKVTTDITPQEVLQLLLDPDYTGNGRRPSYMNSRAAAYGCLFKEVGLSIAVAVFLLHRSPIETSVSIGRHVPSAQSHRT